jgi:hypothetical protein
MPNFLRCGVGGGGTLDLVGEAEYVPNRENENHFHNGISAVSFRYISRVSFINT